MRRDRHAAIREGVGAGDAGLRQPAEVKFRMPEVRPMFADEIAAPERVTVDLSPLKRRPSVAGQLSERKRAAIHRRTGVWVN